MEMNSGGKITPASQLQLRITFWPRVYGSGAKPIGKWLKSEEGAWMLKGNLLYGRTAASAGGGEPNELCKGLRQVYIFFHYALGERRTECGSSPGFLGVEWADPPPSTRKLWKERLSK